MGSAEIEIVGNALAAHPPLIIGALILFKCIQRSKYIAYKNSQ
tara:strand:+ start:114 stop:242 length:129 start_codon:yes stop_codon:yes gene_type:complete